MRVISGKYKGKKFQAPHHIRPTQDMVKKALFDILGDVEGLSFLELFAGTGSVGMEGLSLGVKKAVFVEKDRQCVKCIQQNLDSLVLRTLKYESSIPDFKSKTLKLEQALNALAGNKESQIEVINKDVLDVIPLFFRNKQHFDIIFLDPPYYKQNRAGTAHAAGFLPLPESSVNTVHPDESLTKKTLQILGAYDILTPYGFVIVQHFKRDSVLERYGALKLLRQSMYGDTVLSFYQKN
ncbi:MAG: RsmD family RNA methyltransferase [Candidatus Omnitrophota bacterium]|jgi:16S rRNA (guanine(966)-N(2))-methyltransferase RsmD